MPKPSAYKFSNIFEYCKALEEYIEKLENELKELKSRESHS